MRKTMCDSRGRDEEWSGREEGRRDEMKRAKLFCQRK